jgi:phage terminase large subunit-like protein
MTKEVIKAKKPTGIPKKWLELFKLIPGYDPLKTRGNCWFDVEAAENVILFFETFVTHVEGDLAGKPFKLEPWQKAVLGCLFGWKRPNGTRRYRKVLIFVPRKNGKSTLVAGLVLFVMVCDGERGAQLYSAAADRLQASIMFNMAKAMVENNPELSDTLQVYRNAIALPSTNSVYKAISSDAHTKHGYNPHLSAIDELHAQPNRELVDVLTSGRGARTQPLIVFTTTSDFDRPSICNEIVDYAAKVRDGIVDDETFLPVMYEITGKDMANWTSPEVWAKANPNIHAIPTLLEHLKEECRDAVEIPAQENKFKRLHLNIRTEQDVRWMGVETWDACKTTIKEEDLLKQECFAGLDAGSTSDLFSFVLYFPAFKALKAFFWVPLLSVEPRSRKGRVPYDVWVRQGLIKTTPGNIADFDFIRKDIGSINELYNIKEIGFDRWGMPQLQTQLMADGFDIAPFGQGFASLSGPMKEMEVMILRKELQHFENPVLRWMFSNVAVEMDSAGNVKPAKDKSTEKIDGIVASIMGIGRAGSVLPKKSVYETRGFATI